MECQAMMIDRGNYRRFKGPENAFAVFHSGSIYVTSLSDIDMDGMSCHCVIEDTESLEGAQALDIFCAYDNLYDFHLQNIPFEIVSKKKIRTHNEPQVLTTSYEVKFGELSFEQRARLRFFIKYYTLADEDDDPAENNHAGNSCNIFDRLSFVF